MAGLIGPDSVGKSTLLALLAGVRRLQTGDVQVLGGDSRDRKHLRACNHRIAYRPQGLGRTLYPTLSVTENLNFFGRLFARSQVKRRGHSDVVGPPRHVSGKTPAAPPAIQAKALTRRFAEFVTADRVNFEIGRGEIFRVSGSTGCGKTTTMKMLTGLLPASSGEALLFGDTLDAGAGDQQCHDPGDSADRGALIHEREHRTIEHLLVMPVTPSEIMRAKIRANGLAIIIAAVLSLWLASDRDANCAIHAFRGVVTGHPLSRCRPANRLAGYACDARAGRCLFHHRAIAVSSDHGRLVVDFAARWSRY